MNRLIPFLFVALLAAAAAGCASARSQSDRRTESDTYVQPVAEEPAERPATQGEGPCRFIDCALNTFNYTCADEFGEWDVRNILDAQGKLQSTRLSITYGNGHYVSCVKLPDGTGRCSDDTGNECSW